MVSNDCSPVLLTVAEEELVIAVHHFHAEEALE